MKDERKNAKLWICKLNVIKRIFISVHILHSHERERAEKNRLDSYFASLLYNHIIVAICYLVCSYAPIILNVWSMLSIVQHSFHSAFYFFIKREWEWKTRDTERERKKTITSHNFFSIATLLDTYFSPFLYLFFILSRTSTQSVTYQWIIRTFYTFRSLCL